MRKITLFTMMLILFLPLTAQNQINEEDVYNRIISRKSMTGYKEGTPWDNSKRYINTVFFDNCPPGTFKGYGCYGFMIDMMEYASNYKYAIEKIEGTYNNLPEIHVGDGVRVDNDVHSVVVLKVGSDGHTVTVCEGNYNNSVHWGRKIDLSDPDEGFTYLHTFWNSISTGVNDTNMTPNTIMIYDVTGKLVKILTHQNESIRILIEDLREGIYIVKDKNKTYKIFNKGQR